MCSVEDIAVVFILYVPFFGIMGCGELNCLEETWEDSGYREKRKEGGRAQFSAGISERNSFTLASPTALID